MEKMRPLDGKLKYQIEHLLSLANPVENSNVENDSGLLKPNLSDLMSDDESGDDRENTNSWNDTGRKNTDKSGVYVPPRLQAVPYNVSILCE